MKPLSERMLEAADIVEEASALYGYQYSEHARWSADELRSEATHVEEDYS